MVLHRKPNFANSNLRARESGTRGDPRFPERSGRNCDSKRCIPVLCLNSTSVADGVLRNSWERITGGQNGVRRFLRPAKCVFWLHLAHPFHVSANSSHSSSNPRHSKRGFEHERNDMLASSFAGGKSIGKQNPSRVPPCLSFEEGKIRKIEKEDGEAPSNLSSDVDEYYDFDGETGEYEFEDKEEYEEDLEDNEIECRIEHVSWREVKVSASVKIFSAMDSVWNVLTDYDHLAEFIPNLTRSERIESPTDKCVWLLQQGVQKTLYWDISAQVVLELNESVNPDGTRQLDFLMIEGDFEKYFGKWILIPFRRGAQTFLQYEVNVIPHFLLPSIFLEKIIKADMPKSLQAIADRAEGNTSTYQQQQKQSAETNMNFIDICSPFLSEIMSNARSKLGESFYACSNAMNPTENGNGRSGRTIVQSANEVHLRRMDDLLERGGVHRRVISSITINAPSDLVWNILTDYEKLTEFVPNLATSRIISRSGNHVKLFQEGFKCLMYMVFHAKVILQVYEKHPKEILFKQIEGDFESFRGKMVIEPMDQNKSLLKYVVETKIRSGYLLAESLIEKIVYEDLPTNLSAVKSRAEELVPVQTSGNEIDVETISHPSLSSKLPSMQLHPSFTEKSNDEKVMSSVNTTINPTSDENTTSEPIFSSPSFPSQSPDEEKSTTLITLRSSAPSSIPSPKTNERRKRVKGLQTDFSVLELEIRKFIKKNGLDNGVMPTRPELRSKNRVDLEKAISKMGGFAEVAQRMGLRLSYSRKPKGYWENFENLRTEIIRFQDEYGMDKSSMPSRRTLEKAGRYDISRALEKWGGLGEVAKLMGGLKIRRESKNDAVASTKLNDNSESRRISSEPRAGMMDSNVAPKRQAGENSERLQSPLINPEENFSLPEPKPMKASLPARVKKWLKILTDMDV